MLVEVRNLEVTFDGPRSGLFGPAAKARAVRGISLTIGENETLGLVGESGSGKSTTGRVIVGLVKPTAGTVMFRGEDLLKLSAARLEQARRQMQIVFQDPYSSLDPSMTVEDIVAEPIDAQLKLARPARRQQVIDALNQVGLDPDLRHRYPNEFSGGQRQRIAIARALVLRPSFVVCDEPVSALDVSTKNQVAGLLRRLQQENRTSYLFISHDLPIVRRLSARIAVLYAGRIAEIGPANRVCDQPAHPYTMALVSASPYPHPRRERERRRIVLQGDPPGPLAPPPGCPFHARCPFAMQICREEVPGLTPVDGGGHVACHLQTSGPLLGGRPVSDPRSEESVRRFGEWSYSARHPATDRLVHQSPAT
jgi:oligopeptide/dipeptide ABC transporter ATP-binding protein